VTGDVQNCKCERLSQRDARERVLYRDDLSLAEVNHQWARFSGENTEALRKSSQLRTKSVN
jgi:hypothetical protein